MNIQMNIHMNIPMHILVTSRNWIEINKKHKQAPGQASGNLAEASTLPVIMISVYVVGMNLYDHWLAYVFTEFVFCLFRQLTTSRLLPHTA